MSLSKHPDKPEGSKEKFQELMNAYENLGKIIEQTPPEDLDDQEELKARKAFRDVNFTTENISSITIHIETKMVKHWEGVLTEKLGNPIDRTKGESGKKNGKQWVDGAFKVENEEKGSKMFVTLWHKEKKAQSTMLIQAENSRQFLNISYVTNVIPKLYEEAVDHLEKEIPAISPKKNEKEKSAQTPRVTRTTKKGPNTFSCKVCTFTTKLVSQLNDHMLSVHKQKSVTKKVKPDVTPYKPPTLSATQLVAISSGGEKSKPCRCCFCNGRFENYEELSQHEKNEHELSCSFCEEVFVSKPDLRDHVIKCHVTPKQVKEGTQRMEVQESSRCNTEDVDLNGSALDKTTKDHLVSDKVSPTTETDETGEDNNADPKAKVNGDVDEGDDIDEGDNYTWESPKSKSNSGTTESEVVEPGNNQEVNETQDQPSTPVGRKSEGSITNDLMVQEVSAPVKKSKPTDDNEENVQKEGIISEESDNVDDSEWESCDEDDNPDEVNDGKLPKNTNSKKCDVCANNLNKIDNFNNLEKEHRSLLTQNNKMTALYYDIADEKQVLTSKIVELE